MARVHSEAMSPSWRHSVSSIGLIFTAAGCGQSGTVPTGPPSQASVTVTASSPVVLLGSTLQLAVIVKDASGAVVTDPKVAFSSSSPPIAVVSAAGVVTGVSLGIATISATAEGLSGKLDVQVMFETGTLEHGDSVNFESGIPHRLSNPYDEECVAIWVVVGRKTRP